VGASASDVPLICVVGRRGLGKSEWTRRHIRGCARLLAVDSLGEYDGADVWRLEELLAWHRRGGPGSRRWRLRLRMGSVDDLDAALAAALDWGPCTVVVEEAHRFKFRGADCTPGLEGLVAVGRHRGVAIIACARRPHELPVDVRANASRWVCFNTTARADLAALRHAVPDAAKLVPRLRGHDYIDHDVGTGRSTIHRF